jgi:transposase
MHNKSIYVGIDDFAYKKGKDYMSVVVDQMTHIPIALLEDRNGEALDNWLIRNPQIQYITRDRGRCFTEAINRIIPGVTQICDRFHLIKNMTDTMIPEIEKIIRQTKKKLKYEYPDRDTASSLILQDIFNMGDVRHREKLKIYRESLNLKMQGMTIEQTAAHLGKKSRYIYKLIHNRRIGAYLNEQQKTALKYVSELATIISAGCITRKILAQKMGSKISGALIGRITSSLRKRYQQKRKEVKEHNESIENGSKTQRVSQNQIRKYILKGESDNPKLAELYKSSPQIKELLSVCQNFRDMINGNTYDKDIRKWIEKAKATRNMALTNFAYGIEKDWEAVQAAIDIPFSNGLLEGTVNKIKAVKRQMYNRAGIKLLRAKIIYSQ